MHRSARFGTVLWGGHLPPGQTAAARRGTGGGVGGTVLRGTSLQSGQTVAAKLITAGPSPGLVAGAPDFEKLAAILAGLRHPNLPAVLDSGFTADGSAFFVFELLEGKSLDLLSGLP